MTKPILIVPKGRPMSRPFCFAASERKFECRINDKADAEAELIIYNEIGPFGVSARMVRRELDAITAKRLIVSINSPGGDVFDGISIYNDLAQFDGEVVVRVQGLAASAASIIAMAGDRIEMAKSSFLMIHNAWALAVGNKADMRHMADTLEKIDASLADIYAGRAKQSVEEVTRMMDAETWLTADEAKAKGFAEVITDPPEGAKAFFDLSMFASVPAGLKRQVEDSLRHKGFNRTQAAGFLTKGLDALIQGEPGGASREQGEPAGGKAVPEEAMSFFRHLSNRLKGALQ